VLTNTAKGVAAMSAADQMSYVASLVDLSGTLNVATLVASGTAEWQGPNTVGCTNLVPGSQVTVVRPSASVCMILAVDRSGLFSAFVLDPTQSQGWQGPDTVGCPSLVPGSVITAFQQSPTLFTALVIDRNGWLNTATLDAGTAAGWQGLNTVGNARLLPGSPVAVCGPSGSTFTAFMVDQDGALNVATLDTSSSVGWQGPLTIGTCNFSPDARVSTG